MRGCPRGSSSSVLEVSRNLRETPLIPGRVPRRSGWRRRRRRSPVPPVQCGTPGRLLRTARSTPAACSDHDLHRGHAQRGIGDAAGHASDALKIAVAFAGAVTDSSADQTPGGVPGEAGHHDDEQRLAERLMGDRLQAPRWLVDLPPAPTASFRARIPTMPYTTPRATSRRAQPRELGPAGDRRASALALRTGRSAPNSSSWPRHPLQRAVSGARPVGPLSASRSSP